MRARVHNFPDPPRNAPVGIFTRDRFLSSSFVLIMVHVQFCAIPWLQVFSRTRVRYLIPQLSEEHLGYNFRARPLPTFVILSNWGTYAISPDHKKVNLLACARVCVNFLALPGDHRLEFSHAIASLIPHSA